MCPKQVPLNAQWPEPLKEGASQGLVGEFIRWSDHKLKLIPLR
jgi:hypothetical protein